MIHGEVACYDCGLKLISDFPERENPQYAFRPGVIELVFDDFDASNRFLFRGDDYRSYTSENWNDLQATHHDFADDGRMCASNDCREHAEPHQARICSKCGKPPCEANLYCSRKWGETV